MWFVARETEHPERGFLFLLSNWRLPFLSLSLRRIGAFAFALAAFRRPQAASSLGRSRVTNSAQIVDWNFRSAVPSRVVEVSRARTVDSV
jgi:hypothetical protein